MPSREGYSQGSSGLLVQELVPWELAPVPWELAEGQDDEVVDHWAAPGEAAVGVPAASGPGPRPLPERA